MSVFLIPVDGSEYSMRAIDYVIGRVKQNPARASCARAECADASRRRKRETLRQRREPAGNLPRGR